MPSINDISIKINSLFNDIVEPITLGLNKSNFLKRHTNTAFKFEKRRDLEFNANPILRFDHNKQLLDFLKREKELCSRFQEKEYESEIQELVDDSKEAVSLDNFFLDYSIEINDDEIIIVFNTNSLIFKYEVIG